MSAPEETGTVVRPEDQAAAAGPEDGTSTMQDDGTDLSDLKKKKQKKEKTQFGPED